MNKLGIFINFWENSWTVDYEKYIKKASAIGFDILEFQAQPLLDFSDEKLEKIKACADENNIQLTYSLGLDKKYDVSSQDESVRLGGIKYLSKIMDQVKKMDGKIISGVSYAGWGVPDGNFDKLKLVENSVKSMKEISKKAEDLEITYGVEAVNRFEGVVLNTAKEACDYVDKVGSKSVGVLLDTYHMNIEESSIEEAIRLTGNKLVGFHTGENNRSAPGRGHLDWEQIFKALKDINYEGQIVSEPFIKQGGEVGRSIYVWRDLHEDVSENFIDSEAKRLLEFTRKGMSK